MSDKSLPIDELSEALCRLEEIKDSPVHAVLAGKLADLALPQARFVPAPEKSLQTASQSRVGGASPVPVEDNWVLLVQINFAELPSPLPGFPTEGVLQWFVEKGEFYGMSFDYATPAHVRWYPSSKDFEREATAERASAHSSGEWWTSPLVDELHDDSIGLDFVMERGLPSSTEISEGYKSERFGSWGDSAQMEQFSESCEVELLDLYAGDNDEDYTFASTPGQGDKVGGWPLIVQGDPRNAYDAADTLIFQLDSDHGVFSQWGDGAQGGFSAMCKHSLTTTRLRSGGRGLATKLLGLDRLTAEYSVRRNPILISPERLCLV